MHVAAPKGRLDPPCEPHAPVIAQHLTQRCVRGPLDPVVHRRHRLLPGGVHEGEEHALGHEPVDRVASSYEALVRVTARRGSLLGEERLPPQAPRQLQAHPRLGLLERVHA